MKFPSDMIVHCEPNKKGTEVTMSGWEELVRCKDCKFSSYEPCGGFENVYICNINQWRRSEGGKSPDYYCGWAERKG